MSLAARTRRSVLIVDDEPANIHVLAEALQGAYQLSFATDAERALALAGASPPDLILLDVVMPGSDGFEVLRRLKAEPATHHVPVIFVTAMSEIDDEERGLALGAVDYITKPISAAIVRARVRTHIELKIQRDLLEQRASIDGLTGIANRRRFDEQLEQRLRSAQRAVQPLILMLLDVDHFKQYNDLYGHGPGDECLKRVAAALDACCSRADDFAARYGGEEFAVLSLGSDGAAQAQRVLQAVAALAIPHARSSAGERVSLSIGAAECVPTVGTSAVALLEAADALLYEAKRGGRNRCVYSALHGEQRRIILPGDNA